MITPGADAFWHVLWPARVGEMSPEDSQRIHIFESSSDLLAALEGHPSEPLAFDPTVAVSEIERLLNKARECGWFGPWAASRDWLKSHPQLNHAFGPALEFVSWGEFVAGPWTAVGRTRPLTPSQNAIVTRLSMERLPVPVAVFWEGAIVAVNRAFSALLGVSVDQLHGLAVARLWAQPAESRPIIEAMAQVPPLARELAFEAQWLRSDARKLWVDLKCHPVDPTEGMPGAWIAVANDISRLHRTCEFLEIQRNLVEYSQDGISVVDVSNPTGKRLVFVNSAWEKLTGYGAEEALGRHPDFLQRADRDQPGIHTLRRAISRGEAANAILRNYRKDGALYHCDITVFPLPSERGRPQQYVGIQRDVTAKVETELRLVESERRFRHLFIDNRLPMFLVDAEKGLILDANLSATVFYGYPKAYFETICLLDLGVPDGGENQLIKLKTPPPTERLSDRHQRHRLADGSVREVEVYSGELQFGDGQVRYVIIVDVTAQRQAEDQLRRAIKAAESANVAKSEFLQIVGHEIRTPMNAILGFAELLRSAESSSERDDSIDMILQGTRDLANVLDGVVDYIGWNSERTTCRADIEVGLAEFAQEAVGNWMAKAEAKGLSFKARWPEEALMVWIPVTDYCRMINFLLDNAVKFTDQGEVFFDCKVDRSRSLILIRVGDSGIGMAREVRDRLFTPFCSGDEGIRRSFGGMGLGLARCYRMVKFYGGEISCQSQVGEGSTFLLKLPFQTRSLVDDQF